MFQPSKTARSTRTVSFVGCSGTSLKQNATRQDLPHQEGIPVLGLSFECREMISSQNLPRGAPRASGGESSSSQEGWLDLLPHTTSRPLVSLGDMLVKAERAKEDIDATLPARIETLLDHWSVLLFPQIELRPTTLTSLLQVPRNPRLPSALFHARIR